MALRRQKALPPAEPEAVTRESTSLIASAARVRLDGQSWRTWGFGDTSWQQEAWRLYDVIGELRFVANWIGSACSRVRLYIANVDKNGRVQDEVGDQKIAALSETLLGGPAAQAEALRMLGINLTIVGDAYVIARDGGPMDEDQAVWTVVSGTELKRWGPNGQAIAWLYGDKPRDRQILDPAKNLIIRIWTPHPRRNLWADSPTRGAMPALYEIERLTRFVFAQIDSRLVSAGLFPIPKEMSFPDEDPTLSTADNLAERIMRTGAESLKGGGTAAGVVPIFMEVPTEAMGKFQLIQFTSELSSHALELRNEALRRFALAMDIEPSILSGMGDANHWGAWQIQEGQVKVHIEPLMGRICDGLNSAYLKPALKLLGKNPERYTLWFDTAPLTVRPERLKDTIELFDKGLVSKEAVLLAGDYALSETPSDEEDILKYTRELMLRDPQLFQIPAVRHLAGYTEELLPSEQVQAPMNTSLGGSGPPPPPPPPTGIESTPGAAPPENSQAQNALAGPGGAAGVPAGAPAGLTAATISRDLNTFLVANATVLRAMERAGKRLINRRTAGQFTSTPAHELHTRLPVQQDFAVLLDGAWDHMSALADALDPMLDVGKLQQALHVYCSRLLATRQPHHPEQLAIFLRQNGFIHGQS